MTKLQDKVAIITGGAGGIGQAAAKLMLDEGAKVLLVDLSEDALKETVAALNSDSVSYVAADVSDEAQTNAYVQAAVDRYGGVDILLANAGIEGVVKPLTEYPLDLFDKVIAVNVRGVLLGLRAVFPVMKEGGGGSIVITSSVAGLQGTAGVSAYVTSKHAVIGLMRTAALEGAEMGIRVNTVNPSPIDTRMMRSLEEGFAPGAGEAAKEGFAQMIPLKRYGTPEEVAKLMLFLASDDSSYCTGDIYTVAGGMTA